MKKERNSKRKKREKIAKKEKKKTKSELETRGKSRWAEEENRVKKIGTTKKEKHRKKLKLE